MAVQGKCVKWRSPDAINFPCGKNNNAFMDIHSVKGGLTLKKIIGLTILVMFFSYFGCYIVLSYIPATRIYPAFSDSSRNHGGTRYMKYETDLFNFLERHMLKDNGEILTNIKARDAGDEVLSESVGLLMDYCVTRKRRDLFEREFSFLQENLVARRNGRLFIKWRTGKKEAACNAAIDDFRIMRALLDAYDLWGEQKYLDAAGFIQQGVFENQVEERNLYEFYDWAANRKSKAVPLCYMDMYAMYRVSAFNREWLKVADCSRWLIKNARINETSPFLYKYFDPGRGAYTPDEEYKGGKGVCLTYTLYSLIHMLEMNEDTAFFTQWLNEEMKKGTLYARYDPVTLKPSGDMESTAVYALAAVYSRKAGEPELYYKLLDRMLEFMVSDNKSPYFGGFGNLETGDFHSFDNLTALWALAN
jgi:hypothetical protein